MKPSHEREIPTVKPEELSSSFLPDRVGIQVIECYVVEEERRRYYSAIIWSGGDATSSAKLVAAKGELPASPEAAKGIELTLSYNPSSTPKPGTPFGTDKYLINCTSLHEAQGLVRSFGQLMMNGVKFDRAIWGVQDLAGRHGLKMERLEGSVVTVQGEKQSEIE